MKNRPRIEDYCIGLVREMCRQKIDFDKAVDIVAKVFKLHKFEKEYVYNSV